MGRCAKTVTKGQKAFETEIAEFATYPPHAFSDLMHTIGKR
jgi:hypothetical protein